MTLFSTNKLLHLWQDRQDTVIQVALSHPHCLCSEVRSMWSVWDGSPKLAFKGCIVLVRVNGRNRMQQAEHLPQLYSKPGLGQTAHLSSSTLLCFSSTLNCPEEMLVVHWQGSLPSPHPKYKECSIHFFWSEQLIQLLPDLKVRMLWYWWCMFYTLSISG